MTTSASQTDLLIIGSGGLTREVLELVGATNEREQRWRVVGILDDDRAKHGSVVGGHAVHGPTEMIADFPDARVVICTGSPRSYTSRANLATRFDLPIERYATLVHPSAALATSTRVGAGSIVLAGVVTTADVRIGVHVVVMPAAVMTHDDVLGDFATVAAGVRLSGNVEVGAGAYLGAGVLIRENVVIGERALIGMGSVVLADVPAGEVWVGSPARRLR